MHYVGSIGGLGNFLGVIVDRRGLVSIGLGFVQHRVKGRSDLFFEPFVHTQRMSNGVLAKLSTSTTLGIEPSNLG